MEGVHQGDLGGGYVEEPRRSRVDIEEMDVAAVGTVGGRRWEPRQSSPPAFMVRKAANGAVWEDLKDIRPPVYDVNPLNLNRFLKKLDDWGMTIIEDMDPAQAKKYVFKRFRFRLAEVLQELYFVAAMEGKIKTLKVGKRWLNEQERADASKLPPRGEEPSSFSMLAEDPAPGMTGLPGTKGHVPPESGELERGQ